MATTVVRIAAAGPASWFKDLIRSETIKFRATRSTYASLVALVVVCIGVAALIAQSRTNDWLHNPTSHRFPFDAVRECFRGFQIGQLIATALGVLVMSSEYSSGLIRTTFGAVPQRRSVLLAKAFVVGVTGWVVGTITAFLSCVVGQDLYQPTGLSVPIFSADLLRSVGVAGLYVGIVSVLGVAVGALLRHTAGAVSALFALLFLLPNVAGSLPAPWNTRVGECLPAPLVEQLIGHDWDTAMFSRPVSFTILLAYPVVFLAAACWRVHRTDA